MKNCSKGRDVHKPRLLDLYYAIISNNRVMVKKLVKNVDLDLGHPIRGTTLLCEAVNRGDVQLVELLLEAGSPMELRTVDPVGRVETPLLTAIRLNHQDIFNTLVCRGASLDYGDNYHISPLLMAVKELRLSMIKSLLFHGANITFNCERDNPLNLASTTLHSQIRLLIAVELVSAGLPTDPLDITQQSPLYHTFIQRNLSFFRLLVEAGARARMEDHKRALSDPTWALWLREEVPSATSLTNHCCSFIRRYLREIHSRDIRSYIMRLPLPQPLIRQLLLIDHIHSALYKTPNLNDGR